MTDDTQVVVVETKETVDQALKAGRLQMASEILCIIEGMHGKETVGRLREYVRHEIDPKKYPVARIPLFCQRRISTLASNLAEPEPDPGEPSEEDLAEMASVEESESEYFEDEEGAEPEPFV